MIDALMRATSAQAEIIGASLDPADALARLPDRDGRRPGLRPVRGRLRAAPVPRVAGLLPSTRACTQIVAGAASGAYRLHMFVAWCGLELKRFQVTGSKP